MPKRKGRVAEVVPGRNISQHLFIFIIRGVFAYQYGHYMCQLQQIKLWTMSDWIDNLFIPQHDPIAELFTKHEVALSQKSDQAKIGQGLAPEKEQAVQRQNYCQDSQNLKTKRESVEENTQEGGRQTCGKTQPKRKSKPSKRNWQMGLIAEPITPQKRKIIKKIKLQKTNCTIPESSTPQCPTSQYPTKNFLQNFKGAHLDFLQSNLPAETYQRHEVVLRLRLKNGMSMSDYKQLYSVAQFENVFKQMFAKKYLYRAMMLSRSAKRAKLNHLRKLQVFEQSFQSKVFSRIN